MLNELRTYELLPGAAAAVLERFGSFTSKAFERHGMQNVGYWTPVIGEYNNRFIYMLGYRDIAHREQAWAAHTQDPERQRVMQEAQQAGPQVARVTNMFLQPTQYSPLPADEGFPKGPTALCELRIYETLPGKAQVLHDRFANVTMKLFEKHGIANIGYWTPVVGGYSDQLYYMLGFESLAHREQAWGAFGQDPEWRAASRATQEQHGAVVGRITNVILRPTAFSPLR